MNEQITKGIDEATDALNKVETIGKIGYDIAEGILSNMKVFIHDDKTWKDIQEFELKIHKEFTQRINKAREELKKKDPFYQWQDGMTYYMELRQWKTQELLSFWDNLNRTYEQL